MDKKKAEEEAKEKAKQAQRAAGKLTGMSGKDMFAFGTEFLGEEDVSPFLFLLIYASEADYNIFAGGGGR
jgi:hypothetical protein